MTAKNVYLVTVDSDILDIGDTFHISGTSLLDAAIRADNWLSELYMNTRVMMPDVIGVEYVGKLARISAAARSINVEPDNPDDSPL